MGIPVYVSSFRRYVPLALISFVTLYLELVVIRWLASEVRIFAYFKNFPLLAAFLGFGIGCMLASRGRHYFRFAPALLLLVVAVISFAARGGYTRITFIDPYEYYLLSISLTSNHPMTELLKGMGAVLAIFFLIVALFVSLGEKVGQCFNGLSPLPAYSVNVAFSLFGILLYAWLCRISSGPTTWLLVATIALLPLCRKSWWSVSLVGVLLLPWRLTPPSVIWSPYYRVDVVPVVLTSQSGARYRIGFNVDVNHDGIASAFSQSSEFAHSLPLDIQRQLLDYYNVSYRIFGPRFRKILVLGSGPGNDVAAALHNGVQAVDAVEIDPAIVEIGRRYHPDKPYASPAVRLHVTDARAFLRDPQNNDYDMIVFGALDSHSAFSSMSSLRLDNYVYTVESFRDALDRLAPNGVVAVTFFYYKTWQLERVYNALWRANGPKPVVVHSLGALKDNLVMLAGPGADRQQLKKHPYVRDQDAEGLVGDGTVEPTTDDWPFLYLRERGFPSSYLSMLILILGYSFVAIRRSQQVTSSRFDGVMFLLGVGFMLLETKVLAKIALLVGATWVVNMLVISAVLVMILLANLVVTKGWWPNTAWCFAALLVSILLDWHFRLDSLRLVSSPLVNLYLVLTLLSLPVFFAGILFATFFKRVSIPGAALGYNLFGAMVGGALEYSSMAWGINDLNLLCLAAYAGVAFFAYRRVHATNILNHARP